MLGKRVDIQLLRGEADRAESAGRLLGDARARLTKLLDLFSGDHWGRSAEAAEIRNVLVSTVENRIREIGQLVSAADKIRDGLRETADVEERTERDVADLFLDRPIA